MTKNDAICLILLAFCQVQAALAAENSFARTYHVNCNSLKMSGDGSLTAPLQTVDEVNALQLHSGDQIVFKRGSVCWGSLRMQGSGSKESSIRIGAYGKGALPRIDAGDGDEAALRLFNQEYWEISSLDIRGGTEYGVFVSGDVGTLHHIYLRDLTVHNVRGKLKRKESGLVVISSSNENATFEDVNLDGILAWNTTQWAGIFVSGPSREKPALHVRVRNSMVHDVQGDGIVLFNTQEGLIARSAAWHTGMEHAESIGTPNAMWTWQCTDCVVEENEVFLADSPGVDGGAFDIDYGNTRNTVRNNFAHDTQGYCVSVFGAQGPTTASLVADNLCINNGMSPRLAQRQGAILLMTWEGGSIEDAEVRGNRIDWQPGGDTPAVQTGSGLRAHNVVLSHNEIWSNGTSFVDPLLTYRGKDNRYVFANTNAENVAVTRRYFDLMPEQNSRLDGASVELERGGAFGVAVGHGRGWQLIAEVPNKNLRADDPVLRAELVSLKSTALQFGTNGLHVIIVTDGDALELANDWHLREDGIELQESTFPAGQKLSLSLFSPAKKLVHKWTGYPGPVALGLALRQNCGVPAYGRLSFEKVAATE